MPEHNTELPYESRLIIATDAKDIIALNKYVKTFGHYVGAIGVNPETHTGSHEAFAKSVKQLHEKQVPVFLDSLIYREPYKMHDAIRDAIMDYRPKYITLPGAVGMPAMKAARLAVDAIYSRDDKRHVPKPKLITMLPFPGMSPQDCVLTYGRDVYDVSRDMTFWSIQSGMDGIVCGSQQIETCNQEIKRDDAKAEFLIIASGIRRKQHIDRKGRDLTGSKHDVCLPHEALHRGADMLLVGKTLTSKTVTDVEDAYIEIVEDMQSVG